MAKINPFNGKKFTIGTLISKLEIARENAKTQAGTVAAQLVLNHVDQLEEAIAKRKNNGKVCKKYFSQLQQDWVVVNINC